MKRLCEFLKEGSIYMGGSSYTTSLDRRVVYNDLTPEERSTLDKYCTDRFGLSFINSSFEEQSAALSTIWSEKNDEEQIKKVEDDIKKM